MPVPHQIITASNVIGQPPPPPPPTHTHTKTHTRMKCTVCEVQCVQMTLGGKSPPDDGHHSWNHHQESHIIRFTCTHALQVHARTIFCSLCCCLFNEWLYVTLDQSGFVTTINKQSPWDPQHLKYIHTNAVLCFTWICISCFGDNGLK